MSSSTHATIRVHLLKIFLGLLALRTSVLLANRLEKKTENATRWLRYTTKSEGQIPFLCSDDTMAGSVVWLVPPSAKSTASPVVARVAHQNERGGSS